MITIQKQNSSVNREHGLEIVMSYHVVQKHMFILSDSCNKETLPFQNALLMAGVNTQQLKSKNCYS